MCGGRAAEYGRHGRKPVFLGRDVVFDCGRSRTSVIVIKHTGCCPCLPYWTALRSMKKGGACGEAPPCGGGMGILVDLYHEVVAYAPEEVGVGDFEHFLAVDVFDGVGRCGGRDAYDFGFFDKKREDHKRII